MLSDGEPNEEAPAFAWPGHGRVLGDQLRADHAALPHRDSADLSEQGPRQREEEPDGALPRRVPGLLRLVLLRAEPTVPVTKQPASTGWRLIQSIFVLGLASATLAAASVELGQALSGLTQPYSAGTPPSALACTGAAVAVLCTVALLVEIARGRA